MRHAGGPSLLPPRACEKKAVEAIQSGERCLQGVTRRSGSKLSRDVTQTRYMLALAHYLYGVPAQALPILETSLDEAEQLQDEVLELKAWERPS